MNKRVSRFVRLAAVAALCLCGGCMSLHKAAGSGDRAMADQFLEKGVDVNSPDDYGRTPLMWACGDLEMVRHLVQHGAEVNGRDANGETPLMKAAYVGKPAVVQYLVESGANVNARSNNGWTPLMWAAGHLDIVEYLVEQGADIHARDQQGSTPMELAQQYGRPDVVKYLQGRGAGRRPRKQNLAEEWPPPGKQLSGTDVSASTLASTR